MITICIPVYNFDSTELVEQLRVQLDELAIDGELIVIDDASSSEYHSSIQKSKKFCDQFIHLDKNIGRSKIRNLFLKYSTKNYLLFLDCDGIIISKEFIQNYLDHISKEPKVIVGGRNYGPKPDKVKKLLAWHYGESRESKPARERSKNPNNSFMTNNFMIKKDLLESIKFDESLSDYGHEDTLFGYELAKRNIQVIHIENPILNGDIEETDRFLSKTNKGIRNLYIISSKLNHSREFTRNIKLLRVWKWIRPFSFLYISLYSLFSKSIERNLKGIVPEMSYLDFYKLREIIRVDRSLRS